jgi:hypothetical protein
LGAEQIVHLPASNPDVAAFDDKVGEGLVQVVEKGKVIRLVMATPVSESNTFACSAHSSAEGCWDSAASRASQD